MAEKEYIERGEVLRLMSEQIEEHGTPELNDNPVVYGSLLGLKYASSIVRVHPAADVVEVRHAIWIDEYGKTWCSRCDASNKQYKPPYCPHCGAKMDGGKTE